MLLPACRMNFLQGVECALVDDLISSDLSHFVLDCACFVSFLSQSISRLFDLSNIFDPVSWVCEKQEDDFDWKGVSKTFVSLLAFTAYVRS